MIDAGSFVPQSSLGIILRQGKSRAGGEKAFVVIGSFVVKKPFGQCLLDVRVEKVKRREKRSELKLTD